MLRGSGNRMTAGLGLVLVLLVFTSPSKAQPAPERVRVTDPAELAAMGFGSGAVVYRATGGGSSEPETPDEFGTTVSGYSSYNANQFHGTDNTYAYSCIDCDGRVYHTGGVNLADMQLAMPSGSSFKGLRWWGYDFHAADLELAVFKTCLPPSGAGTPVTTQLGVLGTSSGTPGDVSGFINIPGVETVDNEACTYWVRILWNASTVNLQLYKVRAQWERQVSPAPAVATFNDVPTDHPIFQYIEPLSASAITGGCNAAPPMYCPDAFLTRGQMAVFLAKALGLHWP
jgi:hypothetical protein